ncbi:MAG: hypothetical protein RL291_1245 [Pseudomonadota bacterium]
MPNDIDHLERFLLRALEMHMAGTLAGGLQQGAKIHRREISHVGWWTKHIHSDGTVKPNAKYFINFLAAELGKHPELYWAAIHLQDHLIDEIEVSIYGADVLTSWDELQIDGIVRDW